jgi:CheY-like chemotaxis protein
MKEVLILDDEPLIARMVAQYLGFVLKDAAVLTASNGLEGLEILNRRHIDLALTDLNMPVMDGLTFINIAKESFPELSLMVMTGCETEAIEGDLRMLGVKRVFRKPFRFEDMGTSIVSELEQKSVAAGSPAPDSGLKCVGSLFR